MLTLRIVVAMATLALPSRAAASTQVSDAEKSRIASEIETIVQVIVAAANAVDVDKAFAHTSSSSDFRLADNGTVYDSREAALASFREGFSKLHSQDIRIADYHLVVLTRDLAMYTAKGSFTGTDKSGKTSASTPFAWTWLWRREGTQWKVFNAHQSFGPAEGQ